VSLTPADLDAVLGLVGRRAGLAFPPARLPAAEAGARRSLARAGVPAERYLALLAAGGAAFDDLLGELTVGETYFFREPGQFAFLRSEVLPLAHQRGGLRAWSAGCATGEEAYSLAALFEQEGLGDRAFLLATDLSPTALERARRGVYGAWSLRGDGAGLMRPFLRPLGERFVIDERLRRRVAFAPLNLAGDGYPSVVSGACAMDLILCRNVLIYFDRAAVRRAAERLLASLVPGGWLLTAAADPPLATEAPFEAVVTDSGVFYRRPPLAGREVALSSVSRCLVPVSPGLPPPSPPAPSLPLRGSGEEQARPPLAEARAALARGDYAHAAALADGPGADAAVLRVRALANLGSGDAEAFCAAAAARHPLSAELAFLHALLLLGRDRGDDALAALRRVLYLDRSLAAAHFALAGLLERRGERAGARRAYAAARELAAARPPDEPLPLTDDEPAGRLAAAAAARLAALDGAAEGTS
jgi:chemotaxis protein methyltransferase CheR